MICCIYLHAVIRVFFSVIPANAGVILVFFVLLILDSSYPRECGGDPIDMLVISELEELSPRMRG